MKFKFTFFTIVSFFLIMSQIKSNPWYHKKDIILDILDIKTCHNYKTLFNPNKKYSISDYSIQTYIFVQRRIGGWVYVILGSQGCSSNKDIFLICEIFITFDFVIKLRIDIDEGNKIDRFNAIKELFCLFGYIPPKEWDNTINSCFWNKRNYDLDIYKICNKLVL